MEMKLNPRRSTKGSRRTSLRPAAKALCRYIAGLLLLAVAWPAQAQFGNAYSVSVQDQTAYVTGEGGLTTFDVSDPARVVQLASLGWGVDSYRAHLTKLGNTAYVVDQFFGMRIVDIAEPANPVVVGSYAGGFQDVPSEALEGMRSQVLPVFLM